MKISVAIVLFFSLSNLSVTAQERQDIFNPKINVTWLGIDFTSAKLIGDRERLGSESDIRHLLDAWNDLIIKEHEKFIIADAIGRKELENKNEITKDNNAELDVLAMCSDSEKDYLHLTREGVEEIIGGYNFNDLTGIGLMFNVESFSKLNGEGSIWITFINLETKEVFFTERLAAPPVGMGMRNYWAGTIVKIIERIKKKEFEIWRKEYNRP